jgi:hypothetical protein
MMTTTEPSAPWTQDSAESLRTTSRIAGYAALAAATSMIIGAILWASSGADLDGALAAGTIAEYLEAATARRSLLVGNLTAWIVGVLLFGAAGAGFFRLCRRRRTLAQIGLLCYWTAVPLAIASFVAMLAVVVQLAPLGTAEAVLLADVVGWFGSRADWIATVLVVGFGPLLISIAGRDEWVPAWLAYWAMAAALAGILTVVAMFTGALSTYGFLIVPVGLGWTIAAGVVALRRASTI